MEHWAQNSVSYQATIPSDHLQLSIIKIQGKYVDYVQMFKLIVKVPRARCQGHVAGPPKSSWKPPVKKSSWGQ